MKIGDYVLATKYSDGDPGDAWAVGWYDGERGGRYFVIDGEGKQIRHNGYRRVGLIKLEVGRWLLSAAAALEDSPPGVVNLWNMLSMTQFDSMTQRSVTTTAKTPEEKRARQDSNPRPLGS